MALRIDPYSLQLFVAVSREGSISRAAAKEHIATSALSRRIADLERVLGASLLVRSPLGIELTDAGRVALDRAQQFELELASLVRDVQSLQGLVSGKVRLYANASAVVGFLPEKLKVFCAAYPRVSIELQEQRSGDVVRACLDDVADVGIAAVDAVPHGLEAWTFAEDPLRVIVPRGHALASRDAIALRDVAAHPLVGIQPGGALDRLLHERAVAEHLPIDVVVAVSSFDAVCRMVEAGLGIAIVPRSAACAYAGSSLFELRPLDAAWARRELKLLALRKTPRSAAAQALIDGLRP